MFLTFFILVILNMLIRSFFSDQFNSEIGIIEAASAEANKPPTPVAPAPEPKAEKSAGKGKKGAKVKNNTYSTVYYTLVLYTGQHTIYTSILHIRTFNIIFMMWISTVYTCTYMYNDYIF